MHELFGITRIQILVLIASQLDVLLRLTFSKKRQRKFKEKESLTWKLIPLEK